MARRKLIWQLYPSYLFITLLTLFAVSIYSSQSLRKFYQNQVAGDLEAGAMLVRSQIQSVISQEQTGELGKLCKQFEADTGRRVTVILRDGIVVADSEQSPSQMEDHSGRPEIIEAYKGFVGTDERMSPTLGIHMMYVAVPLYPDRPVDGVVRMSISVSLIKEALGEIYIKIFVGGAVVLFVAAAVSLFFSRRMSRPLEKIKRGAELFAQGNFDHKLKVGNCEEFALLAESMNKMASDLDLRIKTVTKLESMRKDFVANVSHELKTPITSIKGFVETLLDGAIDDKEEARRFLKIIASQSNRLNAIIEDLLSLSRLEDGDERNAIVFDEVQVRPAVEAAIELSNHKAQEKGVQIAFSCPENIKLRVNPALIEQAVVNLIGNAIKYSELLQKIIIDVRKDDKEVTINVTDQGCGIEAKHLPHIFERFYVVDKARSRKLGGTGLGLAIVKHIAQVHGGTVTVSSHFGKGSLFTIHLPES